MSSYKPFYWNIGAGVKRSIKGVRSLAIPNRVKGSWSPKLVGGLNFPLGRREGRLLEKLIRALVGKFSP